MKNITLKICLLFITICSIVITYGQNGYFQDFNTGGVPSGFSWESSYTVSVQNQALEINVNKADLFHGVAVNFPTALDLSATNRRKVSFRIKTDTTTRKLPYEIGLSVFNAGTTNNSGGRRTFKVIYPTGKWQTVSFDFNDASFSANFSAITQLNFTFQPVGYMEGNVKVQIDDLAVGNNGTPGQAAIAAPYFLGIPNQEIPINSSFTYKIRNIVDADNLNSNVTFAAVSSNTAILPNPTFTPNPFLSNNYFTFTSGNGSSGDLITNRVLNMVMTPNANQFGMVTVTVTATAASQIAGITSVPYRYIFSVDVKRNVAPTIGTIPTSLTIGSDRTTTIDLDNIFSGNGESAQIMTISGLSSDQSILQNSQIVASYIGISMSGKISITPIQFASPASKIFNLTVNIKDNGGIVAGGSDQTNYIIPVTILPTYYNAPTIPIIPDQVDNIITQGPRTIRIEPITDGNGGSRISSVTAVSGNTGILANPTVSYTPGNNFALLTYNSLVVGTTNISITATNFGAPANSNGNSSFTRAFVMTALNPPQAGYIEPMTVRTIVGPNDADGRFSTVAGTWYVEHQGSQQTVTINTTTGVFTNVMTKAGTAPLYFAGVWYKPYGGGQLFDFATYPYLSVNLSTTNTAGAVAIDLWDVNGNRYGLTSSIAISGTPTVYTFCYTGTPDPGFDFSKVKTILFNFGVTPFNTGAGSWAPYNGTYTMRDLRIGSSALGSGSCTLPIPNVVIGEAPNPYHLTVQTGTKTVTISGINAGSTPITGQNNNPVSLSVNGSFSPSIQSFNTATGIAVIQYTTGGAATGTINVVGNATGSNQTTRSFTVTVQAAPASQNVVVTNDLNANFGDGNKGQTIDGSPFGVCEIWGPSGGSGLPDSYYDMLKEANVQSMRVGIWDFEPKNDNNNPFVLDKTKLDYTAMGVEFFKKARAAGVERFMVTFFSPPSFVKYNNSYGVPNSPFTQSPGFVVTNTVDSSYYEEYAEYAVAFVQGIKEKSGVDIYGLSLGNEIQFNQTYQSVVYTTAQYVEIVRRVGRRLAAAGLKTFIWGAETLQGQDSGNNYLKAVQNDPETRNYFSGYAIHAYAANGVGQAAPSWGSVVTDSRNSLSNGGLTLLRQSPIATVGPGGEQHNGNGGIGIPIYQSETSQGGLTEAQYKSWDNAMGIFAGVSTSLNVGKNSGWYYIGINKDAKMYYTYKHLDKFVFGGARAIPVTQPSGTNVSAVRNPDGSVCVMLANDNTAMRTFSFGGTNMPSVNRAFLSVDNLFWKDLGTITGSISVPPNSLLTLWGGGNALVAASGITVSGATTTNVAGGSIQFTETVLPANLVDKSVTWSVITLTGNATINQSGLMTAVSNGTVRVRATSVATPTVFGEIVVTLSGQYVKVTAISVDGVGGVRNVATASTLQMTVTGVLPTAAPLREASWSLNPSSGIASINATGLLTGISSGVVTVIGTSLDNNTVTSRVVVTVTSSSVAITSATVTGGSNQITTAGGTLAMTSTYSPANATSTTVGWSISGSIASINPTTGLVTALNNGNGVVTVTSTYVSWGITASRVITISGQTSLITSATINGVGGVSVINTANGTLQMTVTGYLPTDATNTTPTWSILAPSLGNSINASGLLSATTNSNGVVTVQAAFGAVTATRVITISNQNVPVTAATINGVGGVTTINVANGTLQMTTTGLAPLGANQNTTPTWSILAPAFGNSINASGLLSATTNSNGVVTVQAAFGAVTATRVITISNQNVPVTAATINGVGGVSTINVANGTLQMTTTGLAPLGANQNTTPTWSILAPALGNSINASGLLSATTNSNGVVTVQAAFGAVTATRVITISNQNVPVTAATINGVGGVSVITSNLGTLQLTTTGLAPLGANQNTTPTWTLIGGTAASLNAATGVLTAINNGVVTVQGAFGSVIATRVITVSNQLTGISITAANSIIGVDLGTKQMILTYVPATASALGVNWSTNNANASVNSSGLVSALLNGLVTVTATSIQNNAFTSSYVITITNQAASFVPVTSVVLSGTASIISTGSTTITGTVLPANATNPALSWSLVPPTGVANIGASTSNNAVLNGIGNGVVTLIGTSVSNGSVFGIRIITVSGFAIPVTSTTVNGAGGINQITASNGTLQMLAPYSPSNANANTVLGWTLIDPTGKNSINATSGLLQANTDGNGLVTVTGAYGAVTSRRVVTISGQGITATSMTINGSNITTQSGTTAMTVVFNPSNANVGTSVGWTSSNASIASVNASTGIVSAVTNGIVTITGTAGSLTSTKILTISGQFVGIPVTSTTVNGTGGVNQITVANGTLQMLAPYSPVNANQNTLLGWSIIDPTGKNSINATTGLLQANTDGNGLVTITGAYGAVTSRRVVTISGQGITATSITINGANISVLNGTSQMTASFGPVGANVGTTVIWSSNPSGRINGTGLVSANGLNEIVTITGTAGSLTAIKLITITGQQIQVTSISISGSNTINTPGGAVFLNSSVLPLNATNTNISWSIITVSGGGLATINNSGTVVAQRNGNGIVTVVGTALDGSGVVTYFPITISGQANDLISLSVFGQGGNEITANGASKLMQVTPFPSNANGSVTWSIITTPGQGKATIDNTGLVTALVNGNGTVTVVGTSVENSSISAFAVLTISGQLIPITSITLSAASGNAAITVDDAILQINYALSPANTTQNNILYSITGQNNFGIPNPSGAELAIIRGNGVLESLWNGIVTIVGYSSQNPTVRDIIVVTISNQYINVTSISGIAPKWTIPQVLNGNKAGVTVTGWAAYPTFASNTTLEYEAISGAKYVTIVGNAINTLDNGDGIAFVRVRSVSDTAIKYILTISAINQSNALSIVVSDDNTTYASGSELQVGAFYLVSGELSPNALSLDEMKKRMTYQFLPQSAVIQSADGSFQIVGGTSVTIIGTYLNNPSLTNTQVFSIANTNSTVGTNITMSVFDNTKTYPTKSTLKSGSYYTVAGVLTPDIYSVIEMQSKMVYQFYPQNAVSQSQNGAFQVIGGSSVTIIGTFLNNQNLKDTLEFSITSNVNSLPGVSTALGLSGFNTNDISIYPNPTNGAINVINNTSNSQFVVKIHNLNGTVVFETVIQNSGNNLLDIKDLQSGIYFMELITEKGVILKQLIKQ
ncbi:MAG: Ig-like domain-containing protein [Bacteroidota bacterium]|nr:Ig-like domain-containing protein [Bacteroidota bacterium]